MGRKLRTTFPTITEQLLPNIPPKSVIKEKEIKIRDRQQKNFNTHHRASPLKSVNSGDLVYIPENAREGTVVEESSPRSYIVQTPEGTYRRNRRHLVPLPNAYNSKNTNNVPDTPDRVLQTRSGHISKPPDKLNL